MVKQIILVVDCQMKYTHSRQRCPKQFGGSIPIYIKNCTPNKRKNKNKNQINGATNRLLATLWCHFLRLITSSFQNIRFF
jgi:hypothetical protein